MRIRNLPATTEKEYYLILLPLYFVLHGFLENYVSVSTSEVLLLILQYLLATVVLFCAFYWVFRSSRKTALYVVALMSFQFFFGAVHDTAKQVFPNAFVVKYTFILPFSLAAFIILAVLVYRTTLKLKRLSQFLNLLLIVLLLFDVVYFLKRSRRPDKKILLSKEFLKCDSCYKPDIYLIVADEYAGKQELKEIFDFDNSAFEHALQTKGFHVNTNTISNYNYTPFSIASMLNMSFLRNIEGSNSSRNDMNVCYGLINRNNLWNFLEANGYDIKNFSIFNTVDIPTQAPQSFIIIGSKLITSQTFLSRINRDIRFNLVTRFKIKSEIERLANYERKTNEKLYDALIAESKRKSQKPRFIYTHLVMPHYPYYFDSNGKKTRLELIVEKSKTDRKAYINYLIYANKIILQLISHIQKSAERPPVIVLMSDHGFRQFTEKVPHKYYFMNLNAVYFPDRNYRLFYDGISNVNQFRVILNSQFGQKLPLLKDSSSFLWE